MTHDDPTLTEAAFNEVKKRGYTCAWCRHWLKLSTGDESCLRGRETLKLCREFEIVEGRGIPRGH